MTWSVRCRFLEFQQLNNCTSFRSLVVSLDSEIREVLSVNETYREKSEEDANWRNLEQEFARGASTIRAKSWSFHAGAQGAGWPVPMAGRKRKIW